MKKRNPLKLEGQKGNSEKAYRSRKRNVNKLLVRLDSLIKESDDEFAKSPTNWCHAGNMAKVEEDLIEVVNFLSNGQGVERV